MKFSLIIALAPYRDAEILNSIKKLDYSNKDFQVIVVKGTNPSDNRNKGAEKAKGKILGFLDDDGIINEDFLKNVERFFDKYDIDVAGGPQLTPLDEKGFAKISGYALASKFGTAETSSRYKKGKLNLNADEKLITSANLFVKKEVMDKVKFNTKLWPGEDPKFIADVKKAGFKVAYCPDFVIFHRRRPNITGLIKQIFNYGKVRPLKESFVETLKMPVFLIPSLFVIYLAILAVIIIFYQQLFSIFFIPLLLYLLLDILFSVYESIKNKDYKAIFVLPFIYPAIHIGYGLGMIYGNLRKII